MLQYKGPESAEQRQSSAGPNMIPSTLAGLALFSAAAVAGLWMWWKSVSGDNSISAAPAPDGPPAPGYPAEPPQPYSYQYGVQDEYSGTNFAANENSDTKASQIQGENLKNL